MKRRWVRGSVGVVGVLSLAAAAGCSSGSHGIGSPTPTSSPVTAGNHGNNANGNGNGDVLTGVELIAFKGCPDLLGWLKQEAKARLTPWGIQGGPWFGGGPIAADSGVAFGGAPTAAGATATTAAAAAANRAAAPAPSGADKSSSATQAGPAFSSTNVQVAGVDEPDVIKSDGKRLLVIDGSVLRAVDISGGAPKELGSVSLGDASHPLNGAQLLVDGDRAYVLSSGYEGGYVSTPVADITEVSVSDPRAMSVTDHLSVDGQVLSARLHDNKLQLVLSSSEPNGLAWLTPQSGGLRTATSALEKNQALIDQSTEENWLPWYVLEHNGKKTAEGTLMSCGAVDHPAKFAGFDLVSVLTINADKGLAASSGIGDATGVYAEGGNVYASADSLYVSTQQWLPMTPMPQPANGAAVADVVMPPVQRATSSFVHRFDLTGDVARYVASGEVDGTVMSQFGMDEYNRNLRVVTTGGSAVNGASGNGVSGNQSRVVVLAQHDNHLDVIGKLDGLGTGEQLHGVRFAGDFAYVVTFRQFDPLFVVDLSNPTAPKLAGQLKLPGYSAYLHPLPNGLLIGVGQDVSLTGGEPQGTLVSLFDVKDPANPTRLSALRFPNANSAAEWDHRAFLYWDGTGQLFVPLMSYGVGAPKPTTVEGPSSTSAPQVIGPSVPLSGWNGVAVINVGQTLSVAALIARDPHVPSGSSSTCPVPAPDERSPNAGISAPCYFAPTSPQILRTMVAGADLYSYAPDGIAAYKMTTWAADGWAPLQGFPGYGVGGPAAGKPVG